MACIYIFNGHTFNSELELDNFLIEKYDHYKKYGDQVFSQKNPLIQSKQRLEQLQEKSQAHWDAYLKMKREQSYLFDATGDVDFIKEPYKGVTKYLSQKEVDGRRLHPEFCDNEYWKRQFRAWEDGNFGKIEQELFGFKEKDTPIINNSQKENMKI